MKKPQKTKRKCGMYYYTYIPWCFKNDKTNHLDKEDIDWYYNEYLKNEKILYIDMDGVLVDFQSGIDSLSDDDKRKFKGRYDEVPNIFSLMKPMNGAIEAFKRLAKKYDVYILSTSPWENKTALQDKQNWVKKYLKNEGKKRLIFSHHKNLNTGDYLIDDRKKRGADKFEGEHIHFGELPYLDWNNVLEYLLPEDYVNYD